MIVHFAFVSGDATFEASANALKTTLQAGLLKNSVSNVMTHVFSSAAEYKASVWVQGAESLCRNIVIEFVACKKKTKKMSFGDNLTEAIACCSMFSAHEDKETLIADLRLVPHPDGGYFREVYRGQAPGMESEGKTDERGSIIPTPDLPGGKRNTMTSIYWMVRDCAARAILWKRQYFYTCQAIKDLCWMLHKSDHVHYYQGGHPFEYISVASDGTIKTLVSTGRSTRAKGDIVDFNNWFAVMRDRCSVQTQQQGIGSR